MTERYARIEAGVVVNLELWPEGAQPAGLVPAYDAVQIGWTWDGSSFSPPTASADEQAAEARAKRNYLLGESDVMVLPDYPHADEAARLAWLDYRQALRQVPEQTGFPENINWPERPQ